MFLTTVSRQSQKLRLIPHRSFSVSTVTMRDIMKEIEEQTKSDGCVVYMKGTPERPMCGFSKAVVDILNMMGAKYTAFNVLDDPELRENIKEYSSWPTIPQVYMNGDFVGGCDIMLSHYREGDLKKMLQDCKAIEATKE